MQIHDLGRSWVAKRRRGLFRLLALSVICLGVLLRTTHATDVYTRAPDENLYTHFAQTIADHGLAGYKRLFSYYAATPSQWIYPSPTRIGHVLLFAGVMKLTGSTSDQAGAGVSWVLSILSVAGLLWIGKRYFNRWVGLGAALFLATYVVELEFARRAWGEATASFFSLVLFGMTCEVARRPRQWGWYAGFFAAGTACLLVKETSVFAYALCGLWLVGWTLFQARDRISAAVLVLGGIASLLCSFAILRALAGGTHLVMVGLFQVFSNGLGSNDWGAQNASGPWYQFIHLLWLLAPLTLVMAALGGLALAAPVISRHEPALGLESGWRSRASLALLLAVGFIAASSFGPNLQYMRIMGPANPSYCLLAALGVWHLVVLAIELLPRPAYAAVLALVPALFVASSVRAHSLYTDVVIGSGMQDLAVRWILDGAARRDSRTLATTRNALAPPAPPSGLNRSMQHCQRGEFEQCIATALEVLKREPNTPEAWNNAGVGSAGLGRWDDAILYATAAVRLKPDFQLAKNNLAWAVQQKAKARR
jgi:hypothetical protein